MKAVEVTFMRISHSTMSIRSLLTDDVYAAAAKTMYDSLTEMNATS